MSRKINYLIFPGNCQTTDFAPAEKAEITSAHLLIESEKLLQVTVKFPMQLKAACAWGTNEYSQ